MWYLYRVAVANGLHPRITSTVRTHADQARLYRAWLARGKTGLPAAPPGRSNHQLGLAFDMVADNLPGLGALWESWGGKWGGRFNDPVHFEAR